MTTLELALDLARSGIKVFPLSKKGTPFEEGGFYNASDDLDSVRRMWRENPSAEYVGVWSEVNNFIVLDLDFKVDGDGNVLVDGFESIAEAWYEIPDTFAYDSRNGLGRHMVYRAPEGNYPRSIGYRGMKGVDRCSGNGYVAWMGGVPAPEDIADAPEWLLDQKEARSTAQYEGTLKTWYEDLTPGVPNALVRKAMERATKKFEELGNDFSHSDFVELQFELVRLGAEANPGVPEALNHLEELFMSREGAHSRPEDEWAGEWAEALQSAIEKYGDAIELLKSLPEYDLSLVPKEIPDGIVQNDTGKPGFSKLLAALVKATQDDLRITSILWNCPATTALSREWGLQFVHKRVLDARVKPEPTRENPRIEEQREYKVAGKSSDLSLLSDSEREYISKRPTFVDQVVDTARGLGYDQEAYFRSLAWNMASMAFGRKCYVPLSSTQVMGVNLWQIVMGYSGTGKSVADGFQTGVLDLLMTSDNSDVPYDLGADSSIQGLHLALLQRDDKVSLFSADEASGWFKRIKVSEWTSGMEDTLADWYMGKVSASNKISLGDLRGKRASTSFNLHMFATPDRLVDTLTREQFSSGFLARVMWTYGDPRKETDDMFDMFDDTSKNVTDVVNAPVELQNLAADLVTAGNWSKEPVILKPNAEARTRLAESYREMYRALKGCRNWDIVEPALTRHVEVQIKLAGICAMYRGDSEIILQDALHAIKQVEEWLKTLLRVAELISEGDFQRTVKDIEEWVKSRKSMKASRAQVFHQFRNVIQRDSRELDNYLTYLVESGALNRSESTGAVIYEVNGA